MGFNDSKIKRNVIKTCLCLAHEKVVKFVTISSKSLVHHHGTRQRKKNHIYEKFGSSLISKVKLFGKVESNFVFPKPKNKLKRQSCFNFSIKKKKMANVLQIE